MTRRSWMHAALLALLAAGHVAAAPAQTLWRCGADGRSFSDRPCADGVPVDVGRRPLPQAVSEARAVAAREREALLQLAQERRQRHADAMREGRAPAAIRPTPTRAADRGPAVERPKRRYKVRAPG